MQFRTGLLNLASTPVSERPCTRLKYDQAHDRIPSAGQRTLRFRTGPLNLASTPVSKRSCTRSNTIMHTIKYDHAQIQIPNAGQRTLQCCRGRSCSAVTLVGNRLCTPSEPTMHTNRSDQGSGRLFANRSQQTISWLPKLERARWSNRPGKHTLAVPAAPGHSATRMPTVPRSSRSLPSWKSAVSKRELLVETIGRPHMLPIRDFSKTALR